MEESQEIKTKDHFKVPLLISKTHQINDETKLLTPENDISQKQIRTDSQNPSQNVVLPYKEPTWSGIPTEDYRFEVIKSGVIISSFPIKKSFIVIGRLTTCDISLEHPSVSRYHAIFQYCSGNDSHKKGYYIFDLGSTHGTFLNKEQITPKTYYLVKNGHVLKFGGSTRLHILQAPENDDEDKPKESSTNNSNVSNSESSCSWGMAEDAEEEEEDGDLSINPFAVTTENEDLYIDDPKKTLRGWFEREGYELEYNVEERGFKTFACTVQLPIDTPTGEYLTVEASVQGKKKEAVVACALEACRTLDRHGLLRQSHQSSRERKRKNWEEEDFYDSDEDTYLDRTGTIEKKRQIRMMQVKKPEPETFSSLEKKLQELNEKISNIENKLQLDISSNLSETNKIEEKDTLDSYMCEMNNESIDKVAKSKMKLELTELLQEKIKIEKLLNIVKPTQLPVRKFPNMIGKRIKSKLKLPLPKPKFQNLPKQETEEEEEEEEEEIENEKGEDIKPIEKTDYVKASENNSPSAVAKVTPVSSMKTNHHLCKEEIPMEIADTNQFTSESNIKKKELPKPSMPSSDKESRKKKARHAKTDKKSIYDTSDENYSMWMPPTNQSGDGSTHLNLKYGY